MVMTAHKSGDTIYDNVEGILRLAEHSDLCNGEKFHFDHRLEEVKLRSHKHPATITGSPKQKSKSRIVKHLGTLRSGMSTASNEYLQKRKMRHSLHNLALRKHEKVNSLKCVRPRSTGSQLQERSLPRVPKPSQRMHEIQLQRISDTKLLMERGVKGIHAPNMEGDALTDSTSSPYLVSTLRKGSTPGDSIEVPGRTERYANRLKRKCAVKSDSEDSVGEVKAIAETSPKKIAPDKDSRTIDDRTTASIKKSLHDICAKVKHVTPPKLLPTPLPADKVYNADDDITVPCTPTISAKSDSTRNLFDSINKFSAEKPSKCTKEEHESCDDTDVSHRVRGQKPMVRQLFNNKVETPRSTSANSLLVESPIEADIESVSSDRTIQTDMLRCDDHMSENKPYIKSCSLIVDKNICDRVVHRITKLRKLQSENVTCIVTTDKHTDDINGMSNITRVSLRHKRVDGASELRHLSEPVAAEQRVLRRLNVESVNAIFI